MVAKVDINIAVYNHAPYLEKTIESVLEQRTDFPLRLLIGDDCSTDGSVEILKAYEAKYPEVITVIYQSRNIGLNSAERNGILLLKHSTAKYIALLDGDDYWSDSNKLKKQISFLDANPDYAICFHRIYDLFPGEGPVLRVGSEKEETYSIEDLADGNFISTPSVVFRNNLRDQIPKWYSEIPAGDYALHMINALEGKIKYLPEPMAVYRRNVGVWSGLNQIVMWERWVKGLDILMANLNNKVVLEKLTKQKNIIITELFNLSKKRENDFMLLNENPLAVADSLNMRSLLAAIKIKMARKLIGNKK